ncbi:MAG: ABC transporter ATP-binding protein [Candidatus Electrothrix sp. EH2]|nr:ABC transporter ATP-binding protein [Candidatus Electrothrix sp. EH2]
MGQDDPGKQPLYDPGSLADACAGHCSHPDSDGPESDRRRSGGSMLEVNDLRLGIRDREGTRDIVTDLNFFLTRGDVLGIAGESGSGKTLTASALAGLLPRPLSLLGGIVNFEGRPLYSGSPDRYCAKMGREVLFLFQSPLSALDPCVKTGIQIRDTLKYGLGCTRGWARQRTLEAMAKAGLDSALFDAYPFEMSGGQRQRALMAMAAGLEPKLLIADEPTAGQDDDNRDQLISLLADLVSETGTAAILISHDLRVLARLADSLVILYRGSQVETGCTHQILTDPGHPHTRALVKAMAYMGG